MNRSDLPVGEDDLTAHVDGRLPPERWDAVATYLRANPETEERLALDRSLRDALRERLRSKAEEPVPARLRVALMRADRRRSWRQTLAYAAAASMFLAVGAAGGWFARDFTGGPRPTAGRAWAGLARDALSAHRTFSVEITHPVEVKASEEEHLSRWLSKRLKRRLVIPDLSDQFGLELVGGRLLPAGPDVAALLMYADGSGNRLTLYVRCGETGQTALNFMREGEVSTFAWIDDGVGYVVAAAMDRERLQKVARAVSQEFDMEAVRSRRAL
ncbi:anti-sigma factor family protein [Enterovirga rhinocerotis]|uniref:Anti-sigma factor RsiW n=1 Tax=Enterovirga rhinocerotis TaxID=1339210 RepID=A0A4R7BR25_9HYPH|nr:anti-sigma factor [Enterovirga rhinocerotis]TDR87222.1 anti-sigma factor RsiW [Enterovirga rhinocerotis]